MGSKDRQLNRYIAMRTFSSFDFKKRSLSFKVIAPLAIASLIFSTALAYYQIANERNKAMQSIRAEMGSMAQFLDSISRTYIAKQDRSSLEDFVATALQNTNIKYVVFLNADGTPLTQSSKVMQNVDEFVEHSLKDQSGKTLGEVRIGFGFHAVAQNIRNILFQTIVSSTLLLILNIVIVIAVARLISGPFQEAKSKLFESSASLGSGALELKRSSETLSEAAEWQSTAIRESLKSITAIQAMLKKNLEAVAHTKEIGIGLSVKASEGTQSMQKMAHSMGEIKGSNQQLHQLTEIINKVSEKTKLINHIVFKTQLLSFNASIEAARAGEHGRGFSVVAQEVGKLAQMSGNASKEIEDLILNSQYQVDSVIERVTNRISDGEKVADEALKKFAEIAENLKEIATEIDNIAKASHEQFLGVSQTTKGIEEMNLVSTSFTESTREVLGLANLSRVNAELIHEVAQGLDSLISGEKKESVSPGSDDTIGTLPTINIKSA
jgi:methyl-accepting chemotaxis protein